MRKWPFLAAAMLLLAGGCAGSSDKGRFTREQMAKIPLAQSQTLPEASGGFALKIADQTLTADQIITARLLDHLRPIAQRNDFGRFKEKAKPLLNQVLTNKISNILLYQQAKRQAGQIDETLEKAVEAEVRRFIASFAGDAAAAEQNLKEMGMDWQSFRQYQKRMILTQSYIASQLPPNKPITYSELVNYYNQLKEKHFVNPAIAKFELLEIHIDKVKVTDPNQSRRAQARLLANKLIKQINEGEDFITLAEQYPEVFLVDHSNGVQPENLLEPYDILVPVIEKMQPGQVIGPIETDGHIFIVKLEEKQAKSFEPLEKVQHEIEARIIRHRRRKIMNKLTRELAKQVAFSEKEAFIDFCLREIYRLSNR